MKILIVSQYFYPENFIINEFAKDMSKRGHEVHVLTGLPNYPEGKYFKGYSTFGPYKENLDDIIIHRVPLFPRLKGFLSLALNYVSFVLWGSLKAFSMNEKFDLVFCYAPSPVTSALPGVVFRKKGIPTVVWLQDLWPDSVRAIWPQFNRYLYGLLYRITDRIYRAVDYIFVPSQGFKNFLTERGVSAGKVIYMPNWSDPMPAVDKEAEWISLLPKKKLIGFAGNIGKAQNLDFIIKGFGQSQIKDEYNLVFVGDGSEKEMLIQLVADLKLQSQVHFVERKPYSDMLGFFSKMDYLLFSLKREDENPFTEIFSRTIPSKVQAYLQAGKPLIAVCEGDAAHLVRDEDCGVVFTVKNEQELAQSFNQLKSVNLEEHQRWGLKGRKLYEAQFSRERVIDNFLKDVNNCRFERNKSH